LPFPFSQRLHSRRPYNKSAHGPVIKAAPFSAKVLNANAHWGRHHRHHRWHFHHRHHRHHHHWR